MAGEKQLLESELRESRERLLRAQRVARVGFLDWDLRTNRIVLSEETCALTGFRPEGDVVTPEFVAGTVHPDDLAFVQEQLQLAIEGVKPYDIVHRHLRPDGAVVWVHAQAELTRDESGAPIRLLGTIVDITQQKRIEHALRDSELKYRTLYDTAGDAILLMRGDRFIDCNRRAVQLYGTKRELLIGAPPYRYSPPRQPDGRDSTEKALEKIDRALTKGPQFFEWVHCREDRTEFDAEVSLNRLEVGGEVLLQAIVRDVTARRRAERERERFAEQLRELSAHIEAAREEERTGIAREIHDQLGQALTVIKMDLTWIARRAAADADLPREPLLEKVTGLVRMADEVIDEVRRISSELRPAILDQVGLGAAISWKARELETRSHLACLVDISLAADRKLDRGLSSAVFRVFQEALTNVVRHAGATQVDVHLSESDGSLVLEVRDDGRGITREETDDPRSLGLLGIRERVRRLGGTVTFTRAEPRGTVVKLRAPLRLA